MKEQEGGFIVTLFKDKYSKEQLVLLGLNERQIKAVLYVKEKGKITTSEYQGMNVVSKRTAVRDIVELIEKYNIFIQHGTSVGIYYEIMS